MVTKTILSAAALAGAALAGCASLEPREAFPDVAEQVRQRTGARAVWSRGDDSDRAVHAALRDLLARELTADAAVQVALLNNRTVQATYEELGIAQAELVQAGLLTNPVFSALVRFPEAGAGDPNVELSISQNFIQLLSMPLRKRVAAAQYEAAQARVAAEVVGLAADVKEAFYTVQGAAQRAELRRSVVAATAASLDAAERLREAGNITELALATERGLHGQSRLELARAEGEVVTKRERLLVLLGLWGPQATVTLAGRLPEIPAEDPGIDDVESLAVRQRLDLAAGVRELNATYASFGMGSRFAWFDDAEVEFEAERETDGEWIMGPGASVPIPIFDTGAAHASVAKAQVRQAEHRVYALAVEVRSEARAARAEMLAARERAIYYQNVVIPLRRAITQQSQLHYNAMQIGVFELLQAKREEIDAGGEYIEAIQEYWLARTELERAVGGRLPTGAPPTTNPAPGEHQKQAEHQHHH